MPIVVPQTLAFEPCIVHQWIDPTGRFDPPLDPEFPFYIKPYHFPDESNPCPPNWHERLEIFVPVDGVGLFRMGDRLVPFSAGDVLVVDNKRLHRTERIAGPKRQALVISFLPAFVYNLASPLCDLTFLSPFYCQATDRDPVVRLGAARLDAIHGAINALLACYAERPFGPSSQAGCKTHLMALLYQLSLHFAYAEVAQAELLLQQQRARRLGTLLEHLGREYGRKITVADAAVMVGMSESRFMRYFRAASGMTFVSYLTHIRLSHAARLLRESDLNISEIAGAVGFHDQSYFDRQFRSEYRVTPREYRLRHRAGATAELHVSVPTLRVAG
jgi:AraC-like DNA-binding protein